MSLARRRRPVVMDVLQSCRCCLRGASDKDLSMPYTYLGKTEIYADMLKKCFDVHVKLVDEASRGICWTCVDRLRDACHFKLQVKRSEAELQKALLVKVEAPVLPEMSDADVSTVVLSDEETMENTRMGDENEPEEVLDEETTENTEMDDRNEPEEVLDEDPLLQSEAEDDVMSISDSSEAAAGESEQLEPAHAKQQHARNYPERLKRLHSDDRQSEGQPYTCEECDRAFENMSVLTTHIQLTHSSSTQSKKDYSQKHQTNNGENPLECRAPLENHQVIHSEGQKIFKCSQCDYKNIRKSHFLRHQMIHTGEKSFSCNYCDLKCSRKELLEKHLKTKHTTCSYCQFTCNDTESLQRHLSIHTGENFMYSCTYCYLKFSRKEEMKNHQKTHTGEQTFTCSYCDLEFSQKSRLQSHLMRHTREKPFTFNHCNHKEEMKSHQKTYTGEKTFTCRYCDLEFSQKSKLQSHLMRHTSEKPYTCNHCNHKFRTNYHLNRHQRLHTGEKPYGCRYCDRKLSRKEHLGIHLKKHTEKA